MAAQKPALRMPGTGHQTPKSEWGSEAEVAETLVPQPLLTLLDNNPIRG